MNEEEITIKIKEIEQNFEKEVRKIERQRDEKISAIKKGIDKRKIDEILQDLRK